MPIRAADGACDPGVKEILADMLTNDLLALQAGERLWKLYCFRIPEHPTALRHRIYTKLKTDGRLALVTFAAHDPAGANAHPASVRSGVARVSDLAAADLENIIAAMRRHTQSAPSACEELDLSHLDALEQQIAWLQAHA